MIQVFLKKIEMMYKDSNSYYLRINEKMKRLNDILEDMISKLLFEKSIKLWDLYLDQALFTYQIHINQIIKILLFYLLYE